MGFPPVFVAKGGDVALTPVTLDINANQQNVDVFAEVGSPSNPVELTVNIAAAVTVDSAGSNHAIFFLGFNPNSTFRLNVGAGALVLGHGGVGGNGGEFENDPGGGLCLAPQNGAGGGNAVRSQKSITIDNLGEIRGGGGAGGGGGGGANTATGGNGGGGGGGVGSNFGTGGLGGQFGGAPGGDGTDGDSTRPVGNPGTGGAGGGATGQAGGDGGDWGQAGTDGGDGVSPGGTNPCFELGGSGGAGGAAVSIIDGTTTFITTGTISGSVS